MERGPHSSRIDNMFRAIRTAIAGVLALAIAALPVVVERCATSCDAHRSTLARTPECHHAAGSGTRLSPLPRQCGHDHSGATVASANGTASTERSLDSITTLDGRLTLAPTIPAAALVRPHAPPESSFLLDRRSLPLRI
jgi:hypothetical protein